ncbi:expressed unknown protein [Seminavis robusta]|uniref:Uncharacterized protein n=1 Tax=Seminavis robusta TaxID=568900 RepID=A0A9N8DCH2_9STRA|nr:expressed unknown protein [Seminavis robusta]|eukprot:Sro84_g044710.1 n/a (223) ;mRNA; r:36338-37006
MMKEESPAPTKQGGEERSGFNEEYESLADHEVADINPFASKHHRPLVLMRSSSNSSAGSSSTSPTGLRANSFSPFDPMMAQAAAASSTSGRNPTRKNRPLNSLLDDSRSSDGSPPLQQQQPQSTVRMTQPSGMAGFLEMEEEPTRFRESAEAARVLEEQDDLIDFTPADEPIQTTSGLLLTHRRSSAEKRADKGKSYSRGNDSRSSDGSPPLQQQQPQSQCA